MATGEDLKERVSAVAALAEQNYSEKDVPCFGELWRCLGALSEDVYLETFQSITEPDILKVFEFLCRLSEKKKLFANQMRHILKLLLQVEQWADVFHAHPDLASQISKNTKFSPAPRNIPAQSLVMAAKIVKETSLEHITKEGEEEDETRPSSCIQPPVLAADSVKQAPPEVIMLEGEERVYTWMYGDIWDDVVAQRNPLRWSIPLQFHELMTDIWRRNANLARPIHIREGRREKKTHHRISSWQQLLKDVYSLDACDNCQYYCEKQQKWCDCRVLGIKPIGVLIDADHHIIALNKLPTHLRACAGFDMKD